MDRKTIVFIQHLQSKGFIERWIHKSDIYQDQHNLEDCFDKFFTLFVVFNRLYNNVKSRIAVNGEIDQMINEYKAEFSKNKNIGDQKASTICVAYFLKGTLDKIVQDNQQNIASYIEIIPEFNINLKEGVPQKEKDTELLKNLSSKDSQVVVLALLKVLYQIRCNTFHGEKEMMPRQHRLLLTSNFVLRYFIDILNESLNKPPSPTFAQAITYNHSF